MVEFGPIGVNERVGRNKGEVKEKEEESRDKEVGNPLMPMPVMRLE